MVTRLLLEGIFIANGLEKAVEDEKVNYLKSLRKHATTLWNSFQVQSVDADYSEQKIQECYLLRYFQPYANFLLTELSELERSYFESTNNPFTVSFFGVGPGSETIGLLKFLSDCTQINKIQVNLFDKEPWNYSRKIISNHLIPNFWNPKNINLNSHIADFSSIDFWKFHDKKEELIVKSDLVVFQNCLNEISNSDYGQTTSNISGILNHLSNECLIVFIDQEVGRYSSNDYMLNQIIKAAEWGPEICTVKNLRNREINSSKFFSEYPEIINNNLYYKEYDEIGYLEGLLLRKKYPYSSVIFQKKQIG